ncbi:CaiB/BaiF CoA transferase family protein [Rhodococcus opacus]|uniref:CaiB/BaiF CoA transferase family protein n=1 Tax=Rhodococcus opacus TaxID=37919 RepID=UPI001C48BCBA|nr:CoA transferase [Rhodococcus opacus]MBV6759056.1 CoA transferase [Rhodococcus opacus]
MRVVELTHAISGPHCGQILADHGADVIKVEPPGGERTRGAMPMVDDDSTYFANHNRGKRSLVLDLKDAGELATLLKLVESADIVLTNYSVDVPARLGWGYEVLKSLNPRVVMAHITGFGATGPDRHLLAYDGIIQGMSGIPDITGTPDSDPMFVGPFIADHLAAYRAAMSILFALRLRDQTGEGTFVDVNMLTSYTGVLAHDVEEAIAGRPRGRTGNRIPVSIANTYPTRDGYVHLSPLGPVKWQIFCAAIGREDWAESLDYGDAVMTARDEVDDYLSEWCATRLRDDIIDEMRRLGIPCGPVLGLEEAVKNLDARDDDSVIRVRSAAGRSVAVPGPVTSVGLSSSPTRRTVPALGEHDTEIRAELGIAAGAHHD